MAKKTTAAELEAIANNYSGTLGAQASASGPSTTTRAIGGLKNFGGTALDALTVPQSAVATAWYKLTGNNKYLTGTAGPDISWKNVLGNFYTSESGLPGPENVARAYTGTDNRWANLAFQIGTDPLWFVGGGVVNAATKGGKAAKVLKDASAVSKVVTDASSLGRVTRAALKAPSRGAKTAATRVGSPSIKLAAVEIKRIKFKIKNLTTAGTAVGAHHIVYNIGKGKHAILQLAGKTAHEGITISPDTIRVGGVFKSEAEAIEAASMFAQRSRLKLTTGGKEGYKATTSPGGKRIEWTATVGDATEKGSKKLESIAAVLTKEEAKRQKELDNLMALIDDVGSRGEQLSDEAIQNIGNFANPEKLKEMLRAGKAARTEQFGRRRKGYLYLGTRKHHLKLMPPVLLPWSRKGLKATRAGTFFMQPAQRIAHAQFRVAKEIVDRTDIAKLALARKYGLTEVDANGITKLKDDAAVRLGVFRQLRSLDPETADYVRESMRAAGLWADGMDELSAYLTKHYDTHLVSRYNQESTKAYAKELMEDLAKAEEKAAKTSALSDIKKVTVLRQKLRTLERAYKGQFEPRSQRFSQVAEAKDIRAERIREGVESPAYTAIKRLDDRPRELDELENPFSLITREQFVADMVEYGMDETLATRLAAEIDNGLKNNTDFAGFARSMKDGALLPEWNALDIMAKYENEIVMEQVDRSVMELLELVAREQNTTLPKLLKVDPADGGSSSIATAIKYGANPYAPGRAMHSNEIVRWFYEQGTPHLKKFFTVLNPISHFTSNAYGDFMNAMLTGNIRHFTTGAAASAPKTRLWNLARSTLRSGEDAAILDERALKALDGVYDIGGKQYSGWELDMLSRMTGLGRGYHTTDIAEMLHMFGVGPNAKEGIMTKAVRLQANRENAQRLSTWIKHMQGGDDPITAGMKTVRVHFDYNELTDFERLWMRNVLLFYTWIKRNPMLQAQGIVTRPALYNANFNLQETRQPFPNEPQYYREQGLYGIPGTQGGIGLIGNPMMDLYKFELSFQNSRQSILGAVNPIFRVPIEVWTNTSAFTGADISRYKGENKPSLVAKALAAIGVPVPESRRFADSPKQPALPAWVDHTLRQFYGPVGSSVSKITDSEQEAGITKELVKRLTGIQIQENRPEQFKRSTKYRLAKEKADRTRKRNAER